MGESQRQLADLKRLVQLQAEVAASHELTTDQSQGPLRVLGDYARALDVLDQWPSAAARSPRYGGPGYRHCLRANVR